MKIFIINNNLRYKNNFILEEVAKHGGLIIYINRYGYNNNSSNKYIWESYNLLNLQKKLPLKILYFEREVELINFLINLEDINFEIYGDIFFINEIKILIDDFRKEEKDEWDLGNHSQEFYENINKLNVVYNITKSNNLISYQEHSLKEYKLYKGFKNCYIDNIIKFNIVEDYHFELAIQKQNNYIKIYSKIKDFTIYKFTTSYEEYYIENKLKNLPPYEFSENFPIGEEEAYNRWNEFKDSLKNYEVNRNIPSLNKTSKLSPYINSGIISIEIIWNELLEITPEYTLIFKEELLWREFAYHTYYYNPNMIDNSIYEKFEKIPWHQLYDSDNDYIYNEITKELLDNKASLFNKWKNGETGFLIVDAAMKELNTTGYMFNRCRMITACFLIKNLKVYWTLGMFYFMEKLLDGDYIINSFNWQWVNGSGRNSLPYFRVFNPIAQLEKFDKNLEYTKKYLNVNTHEKNFPPIVNYNKSREEILDIYRKYIKE